MMLLIIDSGKKSMGKYLSLAWREFPDANMGFSHFTLLGPFGCFPVYKMINELGQEVTRFGITSSHFRNLVQIEYYATLKRINFSCPRIRLEERFLAKCFAFVISRIEPIQRTQRCGMI